MRAVIFANGDFQPPRGGVPGILQTGDVLIAVDGGMRHCARLGVLPDFVIGDLDSITQDDLDELDAHGVQVVRFPARKDFTDLELALRHAVSLGCNRLVVYGALGARWDQTLANVLLMASPELEHVTLRLVEGAQEIALLRPGRVHTLAGSPGDTLSLIPLGGDAHGITTQGLEYPLHQETLHFSSTRGVSNVLTGNQASLTFTQGLLLCTLIHHADFNGEIESGE